MRYAFEHVCDLAVMVTEAGSNSQRIAEREGFRISYTHQVALILLETSETATDPD